jgi:hypothetical protein
MAFGDVYNIEQRLQQIDERILRIDFDFGKMRHNIIAWDPHDEDEYIAWTVPWGELDARVEKDFIKIRSPRYNAFDEIRESEAKKERDEEKKMHEIAESMADVLYKPLMREVIGA